MAGLQIWNRANAPHDNSALAQAIAGAGRDIGEGIARVAERQKQLQTQSKAAESFVAAMSNEERAKFGVPDLSAFKNLSAQDKISSVTGTLQASAFKQGLQHGKAEATLLQLTQTQIDRLNAATKNDELAPKFLSRAAELRRPNLRPPGEGQEGPPEQLPALDRLSAFSQASQETGFKPDFRNLDDLGRLTEDEAGTGVPLRFEEDPVTGSRFGRLGKSVLPSGTNPAKQPKEADEMFDTEGTVIGHRVPLGGNKFTFRPLKPEASGKLLPVLDPGTGEPVAGMGMDATGKVHDYRDTLQKTMGSRTPGATAPAASAKAKGTRESPHPDEASARKAGVKPGQETWLMHNGKPVRVRMLE